MTASIATMNNEVEAAINRGIQWLVFSRIRQSKPDSLCFGGYFNLYNAGEKVFPLIYLEITAYAAQFWSRLAAAFGEKKYERLAFESGDFLLKSVHLKANRGSLGVFPYGFTMPGMHRVDRYFSFDNSICVSALLDLHNIKDSKAYRDLALETGLWLLKLQRPDGSFKAMHNSSRTDPSALPLIESWFGDHAALAAKNAIGLLKLYSITHEQQFLRSAEKLLNWVMNLQNEDGSFRAESNNRYVFTHAHCYVLEGLLYGYRILKTDDFLLSARSGAFWLLKAQNADGSLFRYYGQDLRAYLCQIPRRQRWLNSFRPPRETGPTAQAVRIWLAISYLLGEDEFIGATERAVAYLLQRQRQATSDPNKRGGFPASTRKVLGRYLDSCIYSSWEVMFASHAFLMFLTRKEKTDICDPVFLF